MENQSTQQQQLDGIQPLPQQALTEAMIHKAADELVALGKNPTQAAVRAHLGGGSFTTIGEAMKTWHKAREEQAARAAVVRLPDELEGKLDGVRQILEAAWTLALRQADDRLTKEREALEKVRLETESRVTELQENIELLEAEHMATAEVLVDREEQLQAAEDRHRRMQEQLLNQSGLTASAKEHYVNELHKRELAEQKAADAVAHGQHLAEQLERAQQQVERLQSQLDNQQQQNQQQNQELQQAQQVAALSQQAEGQAQQQLVSIQQELKALRDKHDEQAEALQISRSTTEVAEQVREQAEKLAEKLRVEAKEREAQLNAALQETAALKATVASLEAHKERERKKR